MGTDEEIPGEGKERVDLEAQVAQFEDSVITMIHRGYEEYDLSQEAIWGVLSKCLAREFIFHLGTEYFGEEEEDEEGEEWKE